MSECSICKDKESLLLKLSKDNTTLFTIELDGLYTHLAEIDHGKISN